MNLAEQVSSGITGRSESIKMNDRYYTIKPPKTKLLAAILNPLSKINIGEIDESTSIGEAIKESVLQYPYMDEVIAICVLGDKYFKPLSKLKLWILKRKFSFASDSERLEVFKKITSLIIPTDFFSYARLAMNLTGMMAKEKK